MVGMPKANIASLAMNYRAHGRGGGALEPEVEGGGDQHRCARASRMLLRMTARPSARRE